MCRDGLCTGVRLGLCFLCCVLACCVHSGTLVTCVCHIDLTTPLFAALKCQQAAWLVARRLARVGRVCTRQGSPALMRSRHQRVDLCADHGGLGRSRQAGPDRPRHGAARVQPVQSQEGAAHPNPTLTSNLTRSPLHCNCLLGRCDRRLAFSGWQVEGDYLPLYKNYGLGLTTWSPLASGLLTGKYSKDHVPPDSRLAQEMYKVRMLRVQDLGLATHGAGDVQFACVRVLAAFRMLSSSASVGKLHSRPACVVTRIPSSQPAGSRHMCKSFGGLFYNSVHTSVHSLYCVLRTTCGLCLNSETASTVLHACRRQAC